MKKLLFIVGATILTTVANAQAKISIGIKGGLNFSKVDVDDFSTSGKTGYHGGVFALFKFAKVGLQPEIIFSQQGSVVDLDDWDSKYVNIPIIFKYYIIAGVNLQAGPQFGFLSKAELNNDNIEDLLKSSDISLGFGAGWDAPMRFSLDARYNLGLTNNSDDPSYSTVKNQVFQISIGIKLFKFGK